MFAWWGGNALLLVPCAICILCKGTCRRLKAIGKEQKEKRKAARDAGQLDDLKAIYKKFKWGKFCKRTWCCKCCCRKVEDKVIEEGEKFVQKEKIHIEFGNTAREVADKSGLNDTVAQVVNESIGFSNAETIRNQQEDSKMKLQDL